MCVPVHCGFILLFIYLSETGHQYVAQPGLKLMGTCNLASSVLGWQVSMGPEFNPPKRDIKAGYGCFVTATQCWSGQVTETGGSLGLDSQV